MNIVGACLVLISALVAGCTFNFDLTSSRTALENQIMGSYQEIDDELILMSTMRGEALQAPRSEAAFEARRNQEFNRDDIEELKDKELLAEGRDGRLVLLPREISGVASASGDLDLARHLLIEENRDRVEIWRYLVGRNKGLRMEDLPQVGHAYGRMQRTRLKVGQWYQNEQGAWMRVATTATPQP